MRLLLVDDHQIILDSLRLLFNSMDTVSAIATLSDSRQVSGYLEQHDVDIVVSDLHMPHLSGIDLALVVRRDYPHVKIILLTMAEDAGHIREAVRAGVNGYVPKKANKEEIKIALETVMAGQRYYSSSVLEELALDSGDDLNNAQPQTIEKLSSRELEVLKMIALEYSTSKIAEKLFISVPTVESHRSHLMKKLNVKSAIGMVKFAIKHGLVE